MQSPASISLIKLLLPGLDLFIFSPIFAFYRQFCGRILRLREPVRTPGPYGKVRTGSLANQRAFPCVRTGKNLIMTVIDEQLLLDCFSAGEWSEWQSWSLCTKSFECSDRYYLLSIGINLLVTCLISVVEWSEWGDWGPCNKSCWRTRTRTCIKSAEDASRDCEGNKTETEICAGGDCGK